MSANFSQKYAVVATIDPAKMSTVGATATTSVWTDAVDMDVFSEVAFILQTGLVAANSAVDFVVYSDAASATGGMTASVGSITQLLNADDDEQVIVVVDQSKLASVDGRDRYVRGKLTVSPASGTKGTATVSVVAVAEGEYGPASDNDLASVSEIVIA